MDDSEWNGPTTRPYTQRKKKSDKIVQIHMEKETVYYGEESFMNAIHPNEINSKKIVKKSSPMQRAIIDCINKNGGKATEAEILKYITEKWDIINKYSERGVLVEPNIRVVRLNCAVKKKGRHLFIQSPDDPETWMFNICSKRNQKGIIQTGETSSNESSTPTEIIDSSLKDISNDEEHLSFEECLFKCFSIQSVYVSFDDICMFMRKYEKNDGLFSSLPFERRVKACLLWYKCNYRISSEYKCNQWYYSLVT